MPGIVLLLPVVAIVVVTIHDVVRRPTLRRLALRNVTRRRGEALLVVVGSLIATAIITASFLVGDTLGASIRDSARTQMGPADEYVPAPSLARLPDIAAALSSPVPGTDGTLPVVRSGATAASVHGSPRLAEPHAAMLEVDFAAARRFGGDAGATGFAGAGSTPSGVDAVVAKDLARTLHLKRGDSVDVYAFGTRLRLRVRGVVPRLGVAGLAVQDQTNSPNVFVAPGTIARLAARPTARLASVPEAFVLVSNDGGVFSGATHSAAIRQRLEARVRPVAAVSVTTTKQDLLDGAKEASKSFTQVFAGIGAFSVIAGILLLVNIFVMLADERKSELGMLRAVGMRRNQLVRAFGIEGAIYAVLAGVAGTVSGIGIGRLIVVVAQRLFNQEERFRIQLRFAVTPHALVLGLLIGLVISLITVWATSIRVGRLNVIRAIRDVPEPHVVRRRLRTMVLSGAGMAFGLLLFASGVAGKAWFGALAGPPIALFSCIPLLSAVVPRRAVASLACVGALAWAVVAFTVLPKVFDNVDIPAFVVQGVILVSAAVALLATNADLSVHLTSRLSGAGTALAARLGLAYPVARRFRTSMLLGMYALVIFTMTFLAVFAKLFGEQGPRFSREQSAGYDVLVDSNPYDPATPQVLRAQPGVASVAPLLRAFPNFTTTYRTKPMSWPLTAFDKSFLAYGQPKLRNYAARFGSERATWQAVESTPDLAIVSDFFLRRGGGPPQNQIHPGDIFSVYEPTTGRTARLTVAGVTTSDWVFNGVMVGTPWAQSFFGKDIALARTYVRVRPGAAGEEVAARLTGGLLSHGVDARTISSIVHTRLQQNEGFFTLMEGYLVLGLLIGIAGLGVVMVRAVRERRRQIGMLRAIGFPARLVRRAFLFEAVVIAVQGVVLGMVLALIVSYQLLANSKTFNDQQLGFKVPWATLAVVLVAAMVASLVAILGPATQASRIKPAVALRIAD